MIINLGQPIMRVCSHQLRLHLLSLLFFEKADSPAMIKHGMDIIKGITEFLHPGQVPVMTCDCPIFAKAKYIQWMWPTLSMGKINL